MLGKFRKSYFVLTLCHNCSLYTFKMTSVLGKNNIIKKEIDTIFLENAVIKTSEDETHTFLTYANVNKDESKTVMTTLEHGVCQKSRKNSGDSYCKLNRVNCIWLYMILTAALVGMSIICLEVYRTHECYALRAELDVLRKDVESLKHRLMEEDYLTELNAFEDAMYAEEATEENDFRDTEYDYVEQEDPINLSSDSITGQHHIGSSTKYERHQIGESKSSDKHIQKQRHSDEKSNTVTSKDKRMKREIHNHDRGVPVIAESYGVANKTEGLRLYESLVANVQEVIFETTENPIKAHHRVSSPWPSKHNHKKVNHEQRKHLEKVTNDDKQQRLSTVPSSHIISRPSRVMQTDKDPSRRVHHGSVNFKQIPNSPVPTPQALINEQHSNMNPQGEIVLHVYQEQRAAPESTIRSVDVVESDTVRPRRRHRKPMRKSSIEAVEEHSTPVAARHRLLPAVHYNGDSSQYNVQHEHYDGNGRLRHPDGIFTDWTPSMWVTQLGMDRHFKFEGGVVKVKDTGIYFVYAQIHYLDEHDVNGYHVYVNEEPKLQCTTMTHSMGREHVKKSNTCFTGAALFLKADDQLVLKDIAGLRYSLFEAAKSFFGLIKLGNVHLK